MSDKPQKESHSERNLDNVQHQYLPKLLHVVNVYNYHMMVKSVSCWYVEGIWLFSNPKNLGEFDELQQFTKYLLIFTISITFPMQMYFDLSMFFPSNLLQSLFTKVFYYYGRSYSYNIIMLHAIVDLLENSAHCIYMWHIIMNTVSGMAGTYTAINKHPAPEKGLPTQD